MNVKALFLTIVCGLTASTAFAQWQWIDETGRKTFSDRPPPMHIPEKNVLARPAGAALPRINSDLPRADIDEPEAAEAQAPSPEELAAAAAQDKQQQAAAAAEAQEAAKREAALQQQRNAQRADNCRRAQASLRTLQSDTALAQINEKGERVEMSNAQRQQDIRRAQEIITRDCGPAPTVQETPQ